MRNVEDKLPEKHRKAIHARLAEAMVAESRPQAERLLEKLARELSKQYPKAAACLRDDVARLTAYLRLSEAALEASAHHQRY